MLKYAFDAVEPCTYGELPFGAKYVIPQVKISLPTLSLDGVSIKTGLPPILTASEIDYWNNMPVIPLALTIQE